MAWLPHLEELDLVGCNWVTEKGLIAYITRIAEGKRQVSLATLRVPTMATGPTLKEVLSRLRPQINLVAVGPSASCEI